MKKRILVFPCGSEIGLEIHNALQYSRHVELFGASSVHSNHGRYLYKNYIECVPEVGDASFVAAIQKIVAAYSIDAVFPAHDSVVVALSSQRDLIGCMVIAPDAGTCTVCRDKARTYEVLRGAVPVPVVYASPLTITHFPVFLKPRVGQGSKGTFIAYSGEEVVFYTRLHPDLLITEYLPGDEYTVDCFTDRGGSLRFAKGRLRKRIMNGISVDTFPVESASFFRYAEKIQDKLPMRGTWFFQMKRGTSGEPVLLEVAPRVAGAMSLYRNKGVNLPLLSVFDTLGMDVAICENGFGLEVDRALTNRFKSDLSYNTVYVDLDDTLLCEGKVNLTLIRFLYQCVNNGIPIHLITKHGDDLEQTLAHHRIAHLFDSVISLESTDEKSSQIREAGAIFIDDSFTERKRVKDACGIPVFDVSAVECLLDWKR